MTSQYYPVRTYGETFLVNLVRNTYLHPRTLCVQTYTEDGEPFATLTVNLCSKLQTASRAFLDVNNCPWVEQFLVSNGIAYPVEKVTRTSGFCCYPLYEFDTTRLEKPKSDYS